MNYHSIHFRGENLSVLSDINPASGAAVELIFHHDCTPSSDTELLLSYT